MSALAVRLADINTRSTKAMSSMARGSSNSASVASFGSFRSAVFRLRRVSFAEGYLGGQAPALKEARPAGGKGQSVALKKPGHAQGSITKRYIHAAQVLFPGAAEKAERRLFAEVAERPR
jgi:hypothetical protein